MADREDLVYQAKLAEQAERYDGKAPSFPRTLGSFPTVSLPRGDPRRRYSRSHGLVGRETKWRRFRWQNESLNE